MASIFLVVLISLSSQTYVVRVSAASANFLGIAGLPTDISQITRVISIMKARGLNTFRMGCYASWLSDGETQYRSSFVRHFLDNTPSNYIIIVDINHLYPATEASAASARSHWTIVKNNIFKVLGDFRNNRRVAVELINEYVSNDFYSRMQSLVNDIRSAGYTNMLVVNKFGQAWSVIKDTLKNTYQSYHYYFNSWSVSYAISNAKLALSKGIRLLNTEVGADYRESSYFTSSTVSELNSFLSQCASLGIGNLVWMNYNGDHSNNYPRYQSLNLRFPTVSSPLPLSSTQTKPHAPSSTTNQSQNSTEPNNPDTWSTTADETFYLLDDDACQESMSAYINKIRVK